MTEFTKVRKGYRPEEVEQELSRLKQKIAEQEEELAVYNKREEELHRNEIEAQMKADLIIEEAQRKADEIQKNAREELKEIRQEALHMRDLMEAFQNEYNQLLRQYLLKIRTDEFSALMDRLGCLIEKTGGEYPYKEE
ncbi:MAG TPA: hypothetical protein IAC91_10680 [Candidatus Faecimorpha stercoravium]|nr:hypothetical protein [Candidatus Faecimorpha stercoravium]